MLYGVDECELLNRYSIDTIRRKYDNGVTYDLERRGYLVPPPPPSKEELDQRAEQEEELMRLYYGG